MIDTKEIRIGNIIKVMPESKNMLPPLWRASVTKICDGHFHYDIDGKDCKAFYGTLSGVTINAKELANCGIELINECIVFEYNKEWTDSISIRLDDEGIYARLNNQLFPFKHIKYIHQLQNLIFAMTGKELTLKVKSPIICNH